MNEGLVLRYARGFIQDLQAGRLEEDLEERRKRMRLFQENLIRERLEKIDEAGLINLFSKLWAFEIFRNKEWLARKIVSDNGLDAIKEKLMYLLYGDDPFHVRFDRFMSPKEGVKGLKMASVTEILCYFNPNTWGIWNRKVREALAILKLEDRAPVKKYTLSGEEYERVNGLLSEIAGILRKAGLKEADLLMVDLFLFWVVRSKDKLETPLETELDFDHNEIRDMVRDIGEWLGFTAETEVPLESGARVDVVWEARIANLGLIKYVFEVHKKGSIDSLILNLQRASSRPDVQKVVAVSTSPELERIEKEVKSLPDSFRRKLGRWDVMNVVRMHENLLEVVEGLRKLGLI